LLESAYEECLCYELSAAGLNFTRQVSLPVANKGIQPACAYRLDLVVEDLGLLLNFNAPTLKAGLKRIVNNFPEISASQRLGVEEEVDATALP